VNGFISSQENRGNKKKEEEEMSDYMVRATAADGQIRAFAITSKEMTEEARVRHNSSPIVTAALGRAMSAAAMMGSMMKGEKDLLTLQIQGDGPMHGLTVTANANGGVKGYPGVADVILPPNAAGKLNVGGAIGNGVLSVIKDMGLKDPYVGQTELQTGEIAEDLTYYFAVSEQVPSSVGLGVLMNKDNTVRQAGGFIIQLMPFTEDAVIDALEQKIAQIASVTEMLEKGMTPEMILEEILGEMKLEINDTMPVAFHCDCSKERVAKALASLSKKDLDDLIKDEEPIEVKCHFCNENYVFSPDDLREIRK
jgi:molecular chaperone Hsp33